MTETRGCKGTRGGAGVCEDVLVSFIYKVGSKEVVSKLDETRNRAEYILFKFENEITGVDF